MSLRSAELSVHSFSTLCESHPICYSLPVEETPSVTWNTQPLETRCYSLHETEERVFSLQLEDKMPLDLAELGVQEGSYTLEQEDEPAIGYRLILYLLTISVVVPASELRTKPELQTVESLHKFGFLTDAEFQRKLRQIEGLPSSSSSSTEEEGTKKTPILCLTYRT